MTETSDGAGELASFPPIARDGEGFKEPGAVDCVSQRMTQKLQRGIQGSGLWTLVLLSVLVSVLLQQSFLLPVVAYNIVTIAHRPLRGWDSSGMELCPCLDADADGNVELPCYVEGSSDWTFQLGGASADGDDDDADARALSAELLREKKEEERRWKDERETELLEKGGEDWVDLTDEEVYELRRIQEWKKQERRKLEKAQGNRALQTASDTNSTAICEPYAFARDKECPSGTINCPDTINPDLLKPARIIPRQDLVRSRLLKFQDSTVRVEDEFDGELIARAAEKIMSRFTSIGCFQANSMSKQKSMGTFNDDETTYDPNACVTYCTTVDEQFSKIYYEEQKPVAIGIHKNYCTCIDQMSEMLEVDRTRCDVSCPNYQNTLCGGSPNEDSDGFWNVFMEYDFQSLGSAGAYDPWRYIWYTVVMIKQSSITPSQTAEQAAAIAPERYHLHAVNEDGSPVFPNHFEFEDWIMYGLQFDVDSTRLVGLGIHRLVGRLASANEEGMDNEFWRFRLSVVNIDETNPNNVVLSQSISEITDGLNNQNFGNVESAAPLRRSLIWTGVSAIVSRTPLDVFCFTQMDSEASDTSFFPPGRDDSQQLSRQDRLFIVHIDTATLVHHYSLGFKVLQMFGNNRYGNVAAVGNRGNVADAEFMAYVNLGFAYRAGNTDGASKWNQQYDQTMGMGQSYGFQYIKDKSFYAGGGSPGPRNSTFLTFRAHNPDSTVTRPLDRSGISVLQIDMDDGLVTKWCQTQLCYEEGLDDGNNKLGPLFRSLSPDIPYAAIFNSEPGYPLTLPAPSIVSARFTMDGLTIQIVFDRKTLRGATPEFAPGSKFPTGQINYATKHPSQYDCALVLTPETILEVGEYKDDGTGTKCEWLDVQNKGETISISLPQDYVIKVGSDVGLLPDVIYSVPENGEYSPAAVSEGAIVQLPEPLFPPSIQVAGNPNVDTCSPITLDASDTSRTGGEAIYVWELARDPYTDSTVSTREITDTEIKQIRDYLASDKASTAKLLLSNELVPAGFTYDFKLTVTSKWGVSNSVTRPITKSNHAIPTVSIKKFKQPTLVSVYQDIVLDAEIIQSRCADGSMELKCEWSLQTGQSDFDMPLPQKGGMMIQIDPFSLRPPSRAGSEFHTYEFQIRCVVVGDANKDTSAVATLNVVKSDIIAKMFPVETRVNVDKIIVLNARLSIDRDDQQGFQCYFSQFKVNQCETYSFKGTYEFRCFKKVMVDGNDEREKCFEAADESGLLPDPPQCVPGANEDELVSIGGGRTIKSVAFPDAETGEDADAINYPAGAYCLGDGGSEGLLVINTPALRGVADLPDAGSAEFEFHVEVVHADGVRTDKTQSKIIVTKLPVLEVSLESDKTHKPNLPLYSPYHPVKFRGIIYCPDALCPPGEPHPPKTYRWEIHKSQKTVVNGLESIAKTNITEDFDWETPYAQGGTIEWDPSTMSNIIIHPLCGGSRECKPTLTPDTNFIIELWASMPATIINTEGMEETIMVENYASADFTTATMAPTAGSFKVCLANDPNCQAKDEPGSSEEMLIDWPFKDAMIFEGAEWSATESSASQGGSETGQRLLYTFGYRVTKRDPDNPGFFIDEPDTWFTEPNSLSTYTLQNPGTALPAAVGVSMFGLLRVCTLYDACSYMESKRITIQVDPMLLDPAVPLDDRLDIVLDAIFGEETDAGDRPITTERISAATTSHANLCKGDELSNASLLAAEICDPVFSTLADGAFKPPAPANIEEAQGQMNNAAAALENLPDGQNKDESLNNALDVVEGGLGTIGDGATISDEAAASGFSLLGGIIGAASGAAGGFFRRRLTGGSLTEQTQTQSIWSTITTDSDAPNILEPRYEEAAERLVKSTMKRLEVVRDTRSGLVSHAQYATVSEDTAEERVHAAKQRRKLVANGSSQASSRTLQNRRMEGAVRQVVRQAVLAEQNREMLHVYRKLLLSSMNSSGDMAKILQFSPEAHEFDSEHLELESVRAGVRDLRASSDFSADSPWADEFFDEYLYSPRTSREEKNCRRKYEGRKDSPARSEHDSWQLGRWNRSHDPNLQASSHVFRVCRPSVPRPNLG
jgi:hypothetical protein